VKILSRLPFSDEPTTISFQDIVEVLPFQIVLWVSVETERGASRPFPAVLDTGHNSTFMISEQKLRDWAGIDYRQLPPLRGVKIARNLLPRCRANLLIHRNIPGKGIIAKRSPFLLSIPSGIIIQGPNEATRLPLLGMRGLVENNLRLVIDGRRREVSLRTGLFW
jgi:hypothetical protein